MLQRLSSFKSLVVTSQDNANPKGRAKNTMAFKAPNLHFEEQLRRMPEEQKVAVVVIKRATDLPYDDAVTFTVNPFCRVNVREPVEDFNQLQRTSQVCYTLDPDWGHGERFLVIVKDDSTLLFNMQRNFGISSRAAGWVGSRRYFGDALLKVSRLTPRLEEISLPLIDPDTGATSAQLVIAGKIISKDEALHSREDVAFEYQRYVPGLKWGRDNLLPTDPGRFSSGDNTVFGDSFDAVTPPVPEGWSVVSKWNTPASEHLEVAWLYAVDFGYTSWYREVPATAFVRRREWRRFVARDDIAAALRRDEGEECGEEGQQDEEGEGEGEEEQQDQKAGSESVTSGQAGSGTISSGAAGSGSVKGVQSVAQSDIKPPQSDLQCCRAAEL